MAGRPSNRRPSGSGIATEDRLDEILRDAGFSAEAIASARKRALDQSSQRSKRLRSQLKALKQGLQVSHERKETATSARSRRTPPAYEEVIPEPEFRYGASGETAPGQHHSRPMLPSEEIGGLRARLELITWTVGIGFGCLIPLAIILLLLAFQNT